MSWFGFGGSGKKDDSSTSSDYSSSYDNTNISSYSSEADTASFAAPSGSMGGGSFEQEIAMEQQKVMIQAVVMKITELSFDQCVQKPTESLSSSEQSCIAATVGKYLDTTELIVARLTGGGQQH